MDTIKTIKNKPIIEQRNFKLELFQDRFVYCKRQFPAFVGGWGTGKTLCLILRALLYSELIPNNLGFLIRKEFEDLRDSTIRDFEDYTGYHVNSQREVTLKNGSVIMFRHFEELLKAGAKGHRNLQNVNLGWAGIEQGEELETDRAFWLLFGRNRRKLTPTKEFEALGLPLRSIFLIANVAGDNWIRKLWKTGEAETKETKGKFKLIEATTYDNAHNLDKEFMDNLLIVKEKKPEMYARYVMNDWTAEVATNVFRKIERCIEGTYVAPEAGIDYIMGIDLAKTHDFNVVTVLNSRTKHVDYIARWNKTSWNLTKSRILAIAKKYNDGLAFIDATGVGDPIVEDLMREGLRVYCEGEKPYAGIKFSSGQKEQLVDKLAVSIEETMITWPNPDEVDDSQREIILQLMSELRSYRAEITASRRIKYGAPEGEFDDCVTSLMLATWGLFSQLYDVYQKPEEVTSAKQFWDRVRNDQARRKRDNAEDDEEVDVIEDDARELDE